MSDAIFFHRNTGMSFCGIGTSEKGETLRINSSYVGMDAARSYTSVTKKTYRREIASYAGTLEDEEGELNFQGGLSDEKEDGFSWQNRFRTAAVNKISGQDELRALDKIRQQCIAYLLELFGLKDRWKESRDMTSVSGNDTQTAQAEGNGMITTVIRTSYGECYMEQEQTAFCSEGSVVTADGRRISFQLSMEMSRRFQVAYEESHETVFKRANTCDPLVINLDENIAAVSDQKFLFDLDADGVLDTISQLNAGSGYLAVDKNGDGIINDGSELFGPESGNGFTDLAKYDEDGNGWIDEGDSIWKKLLIWTKDENGRDKLYHVSEKGVGAVCLQNQQTDFSLNSLRTNQTNALIRSTGIFLYENGNVGTLQHVDMAY